MTALRLRHARVVGGDPTPVDLLVADGRIVAVGPEAAPDGRPAREVTPGEEHDLDGRWLLPGLWDHHVHVEQWALQRDRIDVSAAHSAAEAAALVRAHAARRRVEPGTVLVGAGFRDGLWPDLPRPELLDLGEEIGVCLVSGDVHTIWSNAAATRLLGLGVDGWLLREQPAFDLNLRLGELVADRVDRLVDSAAHAAAARGLVGIVDLEMADAGGAWLRRIAAGTRALRVRAGVYPADLAAAAARGQRTDVAVEGGEGLLVGGPLKVFTDGSLNTRTAYCYDPYPGSDGHDVGLATHEPAALVELLRRGAAAGLRPTVHAIGDRAVTLALDALAELAGPADPGGSRTGTGGSVEHAQLVRPGDLPRFAALGIDASVQPEHAMDDRDVAEHYWAGRTGHAFPLRALLDAGATLRLGSDAPVAPLDPWVTLSAAVTRSRDGREPWHPEQSISTAEALRASTRSRVAVGEPADLVVTEQDPLQVSGEELRTMPVAGTLLGGRWTYGPGC